MKKTHILLIFVIVCSLHTFGQKEVENWESYIAAYEENKPGSTTVRMDIVDQTPIAEYPYILVTGIKYESKRADGFPEDETFTLLHKLGDQLAELINENSKNMFVGSFMFNFERLEYFYIKTNKGIEHKLKEFYNANYPNNEYYINLKEDKSWSYYREFLYPNEEILEYLGDQNVVEALIKAGDNLSKARRVDHWTYFDDKSNMESFKKEIKKLGFKVQDSTKKESEAKPYAVQFYRIDNVDLDSIYSITSSLRKLAISYQGDYDGWETSVEKN
ncbi:DUF695 domain-containing protein [Aquimarina sp. 2201CG14-23]|uniref:DUF695 domain-containing protein n=1 Tax=Aquimarina mycalae TaxID=3040073 RepID=UPI002477FECB|nr:DUF695 domain-containing protein [Aquimarina sp. 2201CG14-23]MDH7444802.1 DUF695 domain-containing protein [Aquimarina sp. 2201CG14-23]